MLYAFSTSEKVPSPFFEISLYSKQSQTQVSIIRFITCHSNFSDPISAKWQKISQVFEWTVMNKLDV